MKFPNVGFIKRLSLLASDVRGFGILYYNTRIIDITVLIKTKFLTNVIKLKTLTRAYDSFYRNGGIVKSVLNKSFLHTGQLFGIV